MLTVDGTGGRKISDKLSLVVLPIKSLIDHTILRCQNLGISACKFTGEVQHEIQRMKLEHIQQYRVIVATLRCSKKVCFFIKQSLALIYEELYLMRFTK